MKYFVVMALILFGCCSFASEVTKINVKGLSNPILFEKSVATRGSPFIYFDQAIESIPKIESAVKFQCQQRFVNLGDVSLSIYCYTANESKRVYIGGELVKDGSAWTYSVTVEPENINNQLIILIEALNNFAKGRL